MPPPDIDIRSWLNQCRTYKTREEVDDSLIKFRFITRDVGRRQVICILPSCFKQITNSKRDLANAIPSAKGNPKDNKQPKNNTTTTVDNTETYEAFKLLENESYKTFTGRQKAKTRPQFKSTKMCPKWNIKGKCYMDCPMREGHVPHKDYSQAQKDAFLNWMNECRKSA